MKSQLTEIIASKAITNTAAIAIYEIDSQGEYVTFAWCDGTKQGKKRKALIRHNGQGNPYFITAGRREYLSDYCKV